MKKRQNYVWLQISLVFIFFMFVGCAKAPKQFDPTVQGSQMIVEPETVRVGVAKIMGTNIVFQGKGFQPKDSVFVKLMGVKKGEQTIDIPIADGNVDDQGNFKATVEKLVKVTEFLRANVTLNDQMEQIVVISNPPIPAGTYKVKAESMESKATAEATFTIKNPSMTDKLKDFIGGMLGKIKKEKKK
ncbi:MAG: hypothetical protein HQK79_22515, partial [Desulfobacterales bacterium]|nr:hypothetical protein [Desulfobacterales bacterium]MBF0396535.1 hypothetical protein [Desulfobacterales bacterium]